MTTTANLNLKIEDFEKEGKYDHIYEQWLAENSYSDNDDTWQFFTSQFEITDQHGNPSTIREEIEELIKEELEGEQKETSQCARKIAAFIYATAVLEQEENNWVIHQSEIEERFEELPENWAHDEQMLADIEQELSQYPGLEGAEFTIDHDDEDEVYFDIMLWTDYIASDYNAE